MGNVQKVACMKQLGWLAVMLATEKLPTDLPARNLRRLLSGSGTFRYRINAASFVVVLSFFFSLSSIAKVASKPILGMYRE